MKLPLDPFPYSRDLRSRPAGPDLPDGNYVYVRDEKGIVIVLPDGLHLHPRVLGGGREAMYAGDMTVRQGIVIELTNLSGTFQFDEPDGLLDVATQLNGQGITVAKAAIKFFPSDGSRPVIIN